MKLTITIPRSEYDALKTLVSSHAQQIETLTATVATLTATIATLEKELSLLRVKKDSSNSSVAPSQDPHRPRRTESLREKTERKPGGQPGHQAAILEEFAEPTEIVEEKPACCKFCGNDLSVVDAEFVDKRQVVDIPPITPTITEYRRFAKRCSCGHLTHGSFPEKAHSAVCYGPNIQALTAYFYARQYVPYERMNEMYGDIFGLSVSTGTLVSMIEGFAEKAGGIYRAIRERVEQSPVVGGDETGTRIAGKKGWTWVFQTPAATFLHTCQSRGQKVVDELFPNGFPKATLVHDCLKLYFNINVESHQMCIAHLLRELKYLSKLYAQQWSTRFARLLKEALKLTGLAGNRLIEKRNQLERLFDRMLVIDIDTGHGQLLAFRNRMVIRRDNLLTFLYNPAVPPDNNASERAVRTYKVKQKVSGLFRSEAGAKNYAVIRSVIDTTIKNDQNVLNALQIIANMPRDG